MPKNDQRDNEPRVFRAHVLANKDAAAATVHEITAAYYQHINGFVTFKDNDGQAVYAAREELVSQIERLRTHVILAIASEELGFIIDALHGQLAELDHAEPQDSITARKAQYHREAASALVESLERLRDIAAVREAEGVSSLPRSKPGCTCQFSSTPAGGNMTLNPGCPVHRTTAGALV